MTGQSDPILRSVRIGLWVGFLATLTPSESAAEGAPPSEAARPAPVLVVVGRTVREVRLDALQRFGAVSPLVTLCAAKRPDEPARALLLDEACGLPGRQASAGTAANRGNVALGIANLTLSEIEALPAAGREPHLREVNGLVLLGLRAGVSDGQILALADRYGELGEQARDGTVFEIASDLYLAHAAFCAPKDGRCRGSAETDAASDLVQAGRWLNDVERLRRAGEMAERVERTAASDGWPNEDGLFQAQDVAGSAYSYAAQFAVPLERLPFMQCAVAAYERALPSADAQAPSFSSARLWQNLGAAYIDRGSLTGDEADFMRGVALYERALPLFHPKEDRQALARTRSNMGQARTRLAQRTRDLALHDRAVADHRAAISGYEEAAEGLDAGFARYRLAQDLGDKAKTADQLDADLSAARVGAMDERRTRLMSLAADSRGEALNELAKAVPVFRRAGANHFLERASEVEAEIRAAQGAAGRSK